MNLIKRKDGAFIPAYPADWELSKKVMAGTEVSAVVARNPDFHRKAFALLNLGFANQDLYDNFEIFRVEMTIDCGFYHIGKDGKKYAQSLAFEKMNSETFERFYNSLLNVTSKLLETAGADIEQELAGYY